MDPELHDVRIDAMLRSVNEAIASAWETPPANLRPGQVWRARWDDVLSLVFVDSILDGTRSLIRVAPVRIGADEADDSAIVLPKSSNPLSVALSIWPELVTEIAEVVLENWVTGVEAFDSLASITAAADRGELRRGLPILNSMSSRLRDRILLELAMEVLAKAANVPSGQGKIDVLLTGAVASTIAAVLDIEPRIALQILRGDAFIDYEQAERLATLFNRDPEELVRANPAAPDELVTTLTSLRRSRAIRELAQKQGVNESHAFATAVRGSYALAARGEGVERDWAARVDRYFEVALSA
jgi:hypothetical protein